MPFEKGHKINLGRKHTWEQKRKISEALKGKMPKNLKLIQGISADLKRGTKLSGKTKRKISKALKGNTHGFKRGGIPWNKDKNGLQEYTKEWKIRQGLRTKKQWKLGIRKGGWKHTKET